MFKKLLVLSLLVGSGVIGAAQEHPIAVEKISADKVISTYDERVKACQKEQFSSTVAFGLFSVAWVALIIGIDVQLEPKILPKLLMYYPLAYGIALDGPVLAAFVIYLRRCYKIAKKYDLKVPADVMIDYWATK